MVLYLEKFIPSEEIIEEDGTWKGEQRINEGMAFAKLVTHTSSKLITDFKFKSLTDMKLHFNKVAKQWHYKTRLYFLENKKR